MNVRKINENVWFLQQRSLLLWMADNDYGRDLLDLPKDYPTIIDISKHHITATEDKIVKHSLFYSGNKWGNLIRERWRFFQEYASFFYANGLYRADGFRIPPAPVAPVPGFAFAGPFYPDADVETDTVDGWTQRSSVNSTWASLRDGAGTSSNDSTATIGGGVYLLAGTTTDRWSTINRITTLFNTSAIPDGDSISAATYSIYHQSAPTNQHTSTVHIVGHTPANDDELVDADFNIANWTMTDYGSLAVSSISSGQYNPWTVNAAGRATISKTGITRWGMASDHDMDDSPPTWGSGNLLATPMTLAENGSNQPKLEVTHSSGFTPKVIVVA